MLKIIHRVNTIKELNKIPKELGVEVDVRSCGKELILNHEPSRSGDLLDDYLTNFGHAFIILEIKEEGIEQRVIDLCKKHGVDNYFLLSVSFPFIYLLSKKGFKKLALRFSEFESIETCLAMRGEAEWVWADTFEKNPLKKEAYEKLKEAGFRICFVCPSRWGRPHDIRNYNNYFKENGIELDAVMTSAKYLAEWG
ncbi:hypothetical protein HY991_00445 [Candidatus Micrarchaeota archaeon]|nr:hypothetical protein [Candidatus Micrarchaeota archaeon]